jgi:hypothetical protein
MVGGSNIDTTWVMYSLSGPAVAPNTWHHVVLTISEATQMRLYVDGNTYAMKTRSGAMPAFTGPPYVGWSGASWVGKARVSVDEAALYGQALSAARVRAHWEAGVRADAGFAEGATCCFAGDCESGVCSEGSCAPARGRENPFALVGCACGASPGVLALAALCLLCARRRSRG